LPPDRRRRRAVHVAGPGAAHRRTGSAQSRSDPRARRAGRRPPAPRDRHGGTERAQRRGSVSHRVTLTLDNRPTTRVTPCVLAVLRERGIRSTFFVVGEQLRSPGSARTPPPAPPPGHPIR